MRMKINKICGLLLVVILSISVNATSQTLKNEVPGYVQFEYSANAFKIVSNGTSAAINIDSTDYKGVVRAAKDLANDIYKVSGTKTPIYQNTKPQKGAIIIGTIGESQMIDQLITDKKINVSEIKGKWESFMIQTVDGNLVVVGSDKRGTIYGIYDISEKIGVSPWYFWADVPIKKNKNLYVKAGRYIQESPKVKYRGIFINDEAPSFTGWSVAKFGGVNSKMYATIFELLLRLKANYLWPAMWGKAFNEDDPLNPKVADEYGIVMGTSHHEPMMRAQKEYTVRKDEVGDWNYATNKENLNKFFYDGLERNKNYDNLITMGMRGEGDVAMGKGDDEENIKTLADVVKNQREIISKVYNDKPENHLQLWAIFTEVQRYYDAGFNVPDDITLLFCDNNWGYIRRTEPEKEKNRSGGSGLYYHIDMNGGPWNDRWINTTTIPKLREQLNLAYQSGLDRIWIINVGDLKPKELPIDFIMHYAWNPDVIPADKTFDYTVEWATRIFGKEHAVEIANLVSKYTKYNLWRKPEAQVPNVFSVVNHQEADSVIKLWQDLVDRVEKLQPKISKEAQDSFFQLVFYPVKASAGLAQMYLYADKSNLYAKQGRRGANAAADSVRKLFEIDKRLSSFYNDTLAGGKWKNMMSDVHMSYTQWFMPAKNVMPAVSEITPLNLPMPALAIEGSKLAWPEAKEKAILPVFDALLKSSYYIDVFNKGKGSFKFEAKANKPWIKLSQKNGVVESEIRIQVDINWTLLAQGSSDGLINIVCDNQRFNVEVKAVNGSFPKSNEAFFGSFSGEFSIPANQFIANIPGKNAKWITLPDLGRAEACMGSSPVTAQSSSPADAARLEYKILLNQPGKSIFLLGILPTQDVNPSRGLRIAVVLDNGEPIIIDARKGLVDTFGEYTPDNLSRSKVLKPLPPFNRNIELTADRRQRRDEIFDNIRWLDVQLDVKEAGMHKLKVMMIDPEVVLERIIVNPNNNHPSYLGKPSKQISIK